MKKIFFSLAVFMIGLSYTNSQDKNMTNPFFKEWDTPFQTPPFGEINIEHYLPAFEEGMRIQKAEVDAIISNTEKPTFQIIIE